MCGIVGVIGRQPPASVIVKALRPWNIAAMTVPASPRW